jgi:hypothetical protein
MSGGKVWLQTHNPRNTMSFIAKTLFAAALLTLLVNGLTADLPLTKGYIAKETEPELNEAMELLFMNTSKPQLKRRNSSMATTVPSSPFFIPSSFRKVPMRTWLSTKSLTLETSLLPFSQEGKSGKDKKQPTLHYSW